jgi:hypothetical protein
MILNFVIFVSRFVQEILIEVVGTLFWKEGLIELL